MKNNWVRILGVFFLLAGLVLGLAPAAALAQAQVLDRVVVSPASVSLAAGGTQQFAAQGYDANNVAIPGLTYFWAAAAASGTITTAGLFTAGATPGTYTNSIQAIGIQGSIAKVGHASVTITAGPGPLDRVTVTPATATVQVGGTQQFSAQGYDASNVAIPGLTYFWAAAGSGTITATGLFTAGNTPGTYPTGIQASAVQGSIAKVGYASVTITPTAPGPLDHVNVTPATATVQMGGTKQFAAQGYDANNVAIPGLTYFWAAAAGSGTITASGLFTAGNTPSTYANGIQASAVQGSIAKVGYASVTVTTTTPTTSALMTGTKRLLLLVAASLRGIGFDNFLGAQWTVKENGATSIIKATPGVVKAISNTSLTLLPNGQTQNMTFALGTDAVILAKDGLRVDEKAVAVTVNDQTRLVVEVPISSIVQRAPPGIRKKLEKFLDKFEDRFLPHGWDKGKKAGWDRDDDDEDDDDDD